jgi:hypothetical protein
MNLNEWIEQNFPHKLFCPVCDKRVGAYFIDQYDKALYINVFCHGDDWISPVWLESNEELSDVESES